MRVSQRHFVNNFRGIFYLKFLKSRTVCKISQLLDTIHNEIQLIKTTVLAISNKEKLTFTKFNYSHNFMLNMEKKMWDTVFVSHLQFLQDRITKIL